MRRKVRPVRCAVATGGAPGALLLAAGLLAGLSADGVVAADGPNAGAPHVDSRLRSVVYSGDEVYRLHGYAGYQIDLEFEPGESFIGLGAGDVEGLAFVAEANHLFIKPKAINVRTNLTVLTTRRNYHFEYTTGAAAPDPDRLDVIYVLRFLYPKSAAAPAEAATMADAALASGPAVRVRHTDYWYCGRATLQPLAAWDDGVHTHLEFNPRVELPAVFVRNDDGSESLVNFNVEHGDVVIHRIARQFTVRRGKLTGCIVNKDFAGSGEALSSGTVAPEVERATREASDGAVR
jgi:type IV secretion system protein VirB9